MDRKTVCVVGAIIVMGGLFAFAGDLDPPKGPIGPTMHTLDEIHAAVTEPPCCSPRPEDIRHYFVRCTPACTTAVLIPVVEGTNGFVITDIVVVSSFASTQSPSFFFFKDDGGGPQEITTLRAGPGSFTAVSNFATGIPVSAGSTITANFSINNLDNFFTIIGYVY